MKVEKNKVIVGLGKTGYACAQYFMRNSIPFSVADESNNPACLNILRESLPNLELLDIEEQTFVGADQIVLSPGVPLRNSAIQSALKSGVSVTGDIAMFATLTDKDFVGITGTNGKSTVTELLTMMAEKAGKEIGMGGNIGIPALDLLGNDVDFNILEISSYQLELVDSLCAKVAVLLNLSPDHLDRYESVEAYYETKLRIFSDCNIAVIPRDVPQVMRNLMPTRPNSLAMGSLSTDGFTFGLDEPLGNRDLGIKFIEGESYLFIGDRALLNTESIKIKGRHNWLNALAALAAGYALELDENSMLDALVAYPGLPHRSELIGEFHGVQFINDSKSTNPGSTLAAIEGFSSPEQKLTLILGGMTKGADFNDLTLAYKTLGFRCLVFGEDRELICDMLGPKDESIKSFAHLSEVIKELRKEVSEGSLVLFSPACASFDQYRNFEHRGEVFTQLVEEYFS